MNTASFIFLAVFALPLVGILYWAINKDKNKKVNKVGFVVLAVVVFAALLVSKLIMDKLKQS